MIKYMCDIKDCGKEGFSPQADADWVSQEMFEPHIEGASYWWARVGLANITLCPEHRAEGMRSLANLITRKYAPHQ